MKNPKFSNNQTFSLASKPPFHFEGMTTRVFPLRASLYQQQRFCDSYLNLVPKQVGRFQAFMPYVLLMIIDYGKMAASATNAGWVSQREIMFSVPLLWYKVIDGRWEFHDFATSTPFIYVDDELSMTLGRTSYGWPKSLAWLAPGLNEWIEDPRAEPRAAAVSTMVFPEVYAGRRQQPRVFLEINESASPAPLDFPQDPLSPFMPWSILNNLARSSAGLAGDALKMLGGLGITRRRSGADPENYRAMTERAAQMSNFYDRDVAFNTVNLKQFRRSERPDEFCYQALTNAQMRLTAFNRGGLMGDMHLLAGDVSGGYAIDLHRYAALPIIETLGITVDREWQGDGVKVSRVRPVMPFWYDVNMDYDVGLTECWRTADFEWRDGQNRAIELKSPPSDSTFCTALGASGQAVAGPFRFPSTTLRVLPLVARRHRLGCFLDEYLNDSLASAGLRFKVWGPGDEEEELAYVYLVAVNYEEMSSATNNIGWWAERELYLCVPVKVEKKNDRGEWELLTVGLVPTFSYANSTTAAIARSEVVGMATTKAGIDSPPNVWMNDRGPAPNNLQTLLTVSSEVLPAIGEGQQTQKQVILDIQEGEVLRYTDDPRWRRVGEDWGTLLKRELERKQITADQKGDENSDARALALEVLANRFPISFFTMKQYRDITEPSEACYQSVVQIRRVIEEVLEIREIETPCHVRIHAYPSQPFVEALGLVVKLSREDEGGVVHCLQPIRPFWMKVSLAEELGQRLLWRAGTEQWEGAGLTEAYFKGPSGKPGPDGVVPSWPTVGRSTVDIIKNGEPVRLRTLARKWSDSSREVDLPNYKPMSLDAARRAVAAIDPQIVLETILSREWESWDPRARWRRSHTELNRRLDRLLLGASPQEASDREVAFFEKTLANIRQESPRPQIAPDLDTQLNALKAIGKGRHALEETFNAIGRADSAEAFWDAACAFTEQVRHFAEASDELKWIADVVPKMTLPKADPELVDEIALHYMETEWTAFREGDESSRLRLLVQYIRRVHDEQREEVLDRLAKAAQKPPFCVPRDCVGPEADRVFPRSFSWDDRWYLGRTTWPDHKIKSVPPPTTPSYSFLEEEALEEPEPESEADGS